MGRPFLYFIALAATIVGAGEAFADLYGYVDGNGRVHVSNKAVNERYALFKRTPKQPKDPAASQQGAEAPVVLPPINLAAQKRYRLFIDAAAKACRLEPALLHAVIAAESGFDPAAISTSGAVGLMQLMPNTGHRYGEMDLRDPEKNIRAGAKYLRDLMKLFNSDLALTLAAYNAGENAVLKYGGRIPPYRQTQLFVPKVLAFYKRYHEKI
jgi:soluble lytic murein transglycosylase-like protein